MVAVALCPKPGWKVSMLHLADKNLFIFYVAIIFSEDKHYVLTLVLPSDWMVWNLQNNV